jgi:hypothetical protein
MDKNINEIQEQCTIHSVIARLFMLILAVLWALFFIPVGIISILIWIISGDVIIEHYIKLYNTYIDIE